MPKRLGDDPLSRQRKTGREKPAASDAPFLNPAPASRDEQQAQSLTREETTPEASASPRRSPPYNDVFFQRRSEERSELSPATANTISSSVAEPLPQQTTAAELRIASIGVPPADSPQPQSKKDSAPPEVPPAEIPVVAGEEANPSQQKTGDRGFFRRIFGRLGQEKDQREK